jgi:hypothetical protein
MNLQAFMAKLLLCNQRVHVRNFSSFTQFDESVKDKDLENDLKENIEFHLVNPMVNSGDTFWT